MNPTWVLFSMWAVVVAFGLAFAIGQRFGRCHHDRPRKKLEAKE